MPLRQSAIMGAARYISLFPRQTHGLDAEPGFVLLGTTPLIFKQGSGDGIGHMALLLLQRA